MADHRTLDPWEVDLVDEEWEQTESVEDEEWTSGTVERVILRREGFWTIPEGLVDIYHERGKPMSGWPEAITFATVRRFCLMRDGRCFASIKTIADRAMLGETAVKASLAKLVADGFLLRTDPQKSYHPKMYQVNPKRFHDQVVLDEQMGLLPHGSGKGSRERHTDGSRKLLRHGSSDDEYRPSDDHKEQDLGAGVSRSNRGRVRER